MSRATTRSPTGFRRTRLCSRRSRSRAVPPRSSTSFPARTRTDSFTVEFFASPEPDGSGHGEGLFFLGSETTDGGTATASFPIGAGDTITATATRDDGSTSEFSLGSGLSQVEIVPEADAMLSRDFFAQNYGSDSTADVYGGSTLNCDATYPHENAMYTVMRFDLGAIPAGATITSARLSTFTQTGFSQNGDPAHWALALTDDSWDESTVTWDNSPDRFRP